MFWLNRLGKWGKANVVETQQDKFLSLATAAGSLNLAVVSVGRCSGFPRGAFCVGPLCMKPAISSTIDAHAEGISLSGIRQVDCVILLNVNPTEAQDIHFP